MSKTYEATGLNRQNGDLRRPVLSHFDSLASLQEANLGFHTFMRHAIGLPKSTPPDGVTSPLAWFAEMIDHCCDYAAEAKAQGRPIVGIMCEFTPREIILAAGAVPVCLCGGSAATIPAAEQVLPANLCPLIKSTFGYHATGKNPFLNQADLVVAETTCDGKKKMFELMSATKPMYGLELPHKAGDSEALERWTQEVRKFTNKKLLHVLSYCWERTSADWVTNSAFACVRSFVSPGVRARPVPAPAEMKPARKAGLGTATVSGNVSLPRSPHVFTVLPSHADASAYK